MGGAWVFPGGAVDARARTTAWPACARWPRRRASTLPDPGGAACSSRAGSRPPQVRIRFDTLFFLVAAPEGAEPRPDGGETVDVGWYAPQAALDAGRSSSSSRRSRRSRRWPASARPTSCSAWADGPRGRADRADGRASRARWRASCSRESRAIATEPLTVAVTGPTGDIGRAFLRACDRSRAIGRVLGMARRPFDPAERGLRKTEYRQGDVLDRDAVDALVGRGRRGRPPRLHHHGRPRGDPPRQPRGLAERVRGGGRVAARAAARLHVVGRRLRLPRRQPAAADRGRARARQRRATTTRRRRPSSRRRCVGDGRLAARHLRPPPVHRRRAGRAGACSEAIPWLRPPLAADRAARSRHALPARAPRRRGLGARRRRRAAPASRAPTTWPARAS